MLTDLVLATALVLAGVALAVAAYTYSGRLERRIEERHGSTPRLVSVALVALRRPLLVGIAAASVYLAVRFVLELDRDYPWLGDQRYPIAVAILLATWGIANLLSLLTGVYARRLMHDAEERYDPRLVDLFVIGIRYLVWFIAVLYLLNFLNISITPIIAGAGIAGIAVALATQDVLSNLLGGAIILLDRPLSVGDKVRIDPYTGTVIGIGLRSTRLRTLDGLVATVPNSRITTNIVVNYSTGTPRSFIPVSVTVDYASPIEESRASLEEIVRSVGSRAPRRWEMGEASVRLGELGRFGPVFVLTVPVRDETDPAEVRDLIYGEIARAVRDGRLSIAIAAGARSDRPA